jgi:SAM-dependent methyltransferase
MSPGIMTSKLCTKLHNMAWEYRLGISARGITEVPLPGSNRSMTLSYADIFAILNRLSLIPDDALIDIGCGKGRVVCCAARFPLREVIGIEHLPELCAAARRNADRMRDRKAPITIVQAHAEEFDYRQGSVLYFSLCTRICNEARVHATWWRRRVAVARWTLRSRYS